MAGNTHKTPVQVQSSTPATCSSDEDLSLNPDSFSLEDFDREAGNQGPSACNPIRSVEGRRSETNPKDPGLVVEQSEPNHAFGARPITMNPEILENPLPPVDRLSDHLKTLTLEEAGMTPTIPGYDEPISPPNYIALDYKLKITGSSNDSRHQLVKLENFFREAETQAQGFDDKTTSTLEARAKCVEETKNNVWVVGPSGSGKTWSSRRFATLAAAGLDVGFDAKYVFFMQCGNLEMEEKRSLPEFLANEIGISEEFTQQLAGLKDSEEVLFVVDAVDELDVKRLTCAKAKSAGMNVAKTGYEHLHNLLDGNVFRKAKKLWTSHSMPCQMVRMRFSRSVVFEVLPLDDDKQKQLFVSNTRQMSESCRRALKVLQSKPVVKDLCRSPFYASIFNSTVAANVGLNRYSVSNLLCTGLHYNMQKKRNSKEKFDAVCENQLPKLCKLAWDNFVGKDYPITSILVKKIDEEIAKLFLEGTKRRGNLERYKFTHLIRQAFLASLHAMASLSVDEFIRHVDVDRMTSEKWATMALCMFGMCDSQKKHLSEYVNLQVSKIDGEKVSHLKAIAIKVAREAKVANGYDERIQSLFLVGRWMQEANSDDMISAVSAHLPTKVALADKIYPSDVGALSYLACSHKMVLTLGIMSAPRFQGDAALALCKNVAESDNLHISFVDLRGCEVTADVGREVSKFIATVTSIRLDGAKVTGETLITIVQAVSAVHEAHSYQPGHRLKLHLGDSKMCVGMDLMNALSQAVKNLSELTLIVQHAPIDGCRGLVKAVSELDGKLDLLDLGIPLLNDKIAGVLGRNSHKFKCLRLRGCEVTEHALPALIKEMHHNKVQMRGFYLDHVSVTERDVETLGKCLSKFRCWLVVMYCDLTKKEYEILKNSHQALGAENFLQVFLGDVEGVGNSVTIRHM